jgi:hypothetical protein
MRWLAFSWAAWLLAVGTALSGVVVVHPGPAERAAVPLARNYDTQWSEATTESLTACFAEHARLAAEAMIQPTELEQLCIQHLKLSI